MRTLFTSFTTRGRAFLAAGVAAGALGLGLGQRALLSVGVVLILLPVLAALTASRNRYRIRCLRRIVPARVPAGQPASVVIRLENISRLPTGLLLAEDTIPFALGARPRFVLDRVESAGGRQFSYQIQSDARGRFAIGPLHVRLADVFGLVRLGSTAAAPGMLVVTPTITALPRTALVGSWLGSGGTRATLTAAAGDDDVVPRPYRDGDELRRVHWRSTARHGELMVRREEQHWRNRVVLFLDARSNAHGGRGPASSFEYAVSAAASIGAHLAREGIDGQFFTDAGAVPTPGSFEDGLLDTLAVIRPSRNTGLAAGLGQIPRGDSGLLIAVAGHMEPEQAQQLAAARRDGPAMALLLDATSWASDRPGAPPSRAARIALGILATAGWRVVTVTAGTPLTSAWQRLARSPAASAPASSRPDHVGAGR